MLCTLFIIGNNKEHTCYEQSNHDVKTLNHYIYQYQPSKVTQRTKSVFIILMMNIQHPI